MDSPLPRIDDELKGTKTDVANGEHGIKRLARECFMIPCSCDICLTQYIRYEAQKELAWTYSGFRNSRDITALVKSYTEVIMKESGILRHFIGEHGNKFVKWWRRQTVAERKNVLLRIRPKLSANPYPHIDLEFRHSLTAVRESRYALLLPYVNLESLSAGYSRLVNLMHYRAKHNPEEWVLLDNHIVFKAWRFGAFEERYAEGCVVMHGAEYGRWMQWNGDIVHREDAFGAPRATLILEAQAELMVFLREVFSLAMNDAVIPPAGSELTADGMTTQSRWQQVVTAGLKAKHEQKWIPFTETLDNQPFLGPPTFDIDILIDSAESQAADAQDRLWLLRTEPSHFFENAKHIRECIPNQDEAKLYNHIAILLFHDPMINALGWRWIQSACKNVKAQYIKHKHHISTRSTLPYEYEQAMGVLKGILLFYITVWTQKLGDSLCMMPEFQTPLKLTAIKNDQFVVFTNTKEGKMRRDLYSKDRILWCLVQLSNGRLYGETSEVSRFDYSDVLNILDDYLARCSPAEAARLDQSSYNIISGLAAAYQMLAMLHIHRSMWRAYPGLDGLEFYLKTDHCKAFSATKLGEYIQPLENFQMPKGKNDWEWLGTAENARYMLDDAWSMAIDSQAGVLYECKVIYSDELKDWMALMWQDQTAISTPQAIAQRRLILARQRKLPIPRTPTPPTDDHPPNTQGGPQSTSIEHPPQPKQKTRPSNHSLVKDLDQLNVDAQQPLEPITPIYTLKSESMQTIRKILPDKEDSTVKGNVNWVDFVCLMDDIGFCTEHRGGSAFTFKKAETLASETQNGSPKMSIVIHRPHPSSEMLPLMLKGIGRRFARRFGWHRALFRCAKEDLS